MKAFPMSVGKKSFKLMHNSKESLEGQLLDRSGQAYRGAIYIYNIKNCFLVGSGGRGMSNGLYLVW